MAKTLEEISKDLYEWQKENQKERCVLLIAGLENNNIQINVQGNKGETLTCVALAIANAAEIRKLFTLALELANKHIPQEEEE